jgi:hypothetical protein
LHHEVKGSSLYQADLEKSSKSTIERKSMSTKTTFKRIALVAVAALGFGVMSAVSPAQAAGDSSFALNTTSITVVSSQTGDATTTSATSKLMAVVKITVSDATSNDDLESGDTITATVEGVPTTVLAKTLSANRSDLSFRELKLNNGATAFISDTPSGGSVTDGAIGSLNTAHTDSASTAYNSVYYMGIHADSVTALDKGEYTVRFRLTNSDGFVLKDSNLKVKFVSSAADSGATLTITQTGVVTAGSAYAYTTANNTKVVLADANAGLIQTYASGSTVMTPDAPTLAADVVDEDGTSQTTGSLVAPILIVDNGTAGQDHVAPSTNVANTAALANKNGTYGIYTTQTTAFDTATALVTANDSPYFRVRYGATSATKAFTLYSAASATAADSTVALTATGKVAGTNNTGKVAVANDFTLPLSTKTATLTVRALTSGSAAVQDYPIVFTTTWTNAAAGDVSPRAGATYATTVRTDSSGYATLSISNNSPIDGAVVSVAMTGFTGTPLAQTVRWMKSKPAAVTADPVSNYSATVKTAQKITWTFTDTFGAPVVGEGVTLTISGANSATSTVVIPSATTDAKGEVSYSFTDAAGVEDSTTLGTTTVTATSKTDTTITLGRTITWKTTAPVIATLTGYYNENEGTSGASAYSDVVPTTAIYDTATTATGFLINTAIDTTVSNLTAGDQGEQVAFRYIAKDSAGAAVTGVPVTVSVSAGLHLLSSAGIPVTSRTIYPATGGFVDFIVMGTATGTGTITVTAGSVSKTATINYKNALTDARYITLTGDATGTANADKLPSMTATVTDRFGNAVSGATIDVTHTGVGRLGGGNKFATFTTSTDGKFVFELSSTEAGTASVSAKATAASGQLTDLAGYVGSAVIEGVTAGVRTATASVTFAAGTNAAQAAAEAATDAAAEAIDAANAATDAANLAAEAADAATVAAEEARDAADAATAAVEELATQVATLMAALKAQITTLANTVAKIAKKVKA